MRYHLLGPVEVSVRGEVRPVGGARQRTVLAALALNVGKIVPIEALVDAVWNTSPPATAHRQVLTSVSTLRRLVGTAIETRPSGYVLRAGPDDVDVCVFERQLAEARRLVAAGALDAGAARMREALGLWRGPALVGVRGLRADAARLDELRLSVLEECLKIEVALGANADTVVEVSALVTAHPLRERLRALLMMALHQVDRQAEALEVYRAGRARLVEELGVEPGPELQRVHQMILAGDRPVGPAWRGRVSLLAGRDADSSPRQVQQVLGPAWYSEPPDPVSSTFFGVTMNSTSGRMPDFRVGAVRLWDCGARWSKIQPRRDVFDWRTLDRLVTGAERVGLPVLYTMGLPPGWACPDAPRAPYTDDSRAAPPDDLADWDAYVHATVTRYRGRIEAYELWDYVNTPYRFNDSVEVLVEMVHRAARIIRRVDPDAIVVAPSFGDLWTPAGREALHAYAAAGGYDPCDVAAVKLHPREPAGPPEEMVELAHLVHLTLHDAGVHRDIWSTGPGHDTLTGPRLEQAKAGAYAVRFFLAGMYARCQRMYFYNWGSRLIRLVLQAEGGPPTQAARFVERLQTWLDGAAARSCGHGADVGLPPNVWQLRLSCPGPAGRHEAVVRWTEVGSALMAVEPGVDRIDRLDGVSEPPPPGDQLRVTEQPVLIRYRFGSRPA